MMALAEKAIQDGERARVLFEILLSHLGCTFDDDLEKVYFELKRKQDEYNEAVQMMTMVLHERKKQTRKTVGVS